MRAEVISIGTELLIGSITNTNARFISGRLAQNAIDVYHQVTVGDNVGRLVETLETAARRADIVITSGGLGPTEDDVTLESLLKFLNVPSVFHAPTRNHIRSRLKAAHLRLTPMALRQCQVPKGSLVFKNLNGAAPGLLCRAIRDRNSKWILVLPGPPRELEPMFDRAALPALLSHAKIKREHFLVRSLKIAGLTETQVAERVSLLLKSKPPLTVGIYAKPGLVTLKVMAKSASGRAAASMVAKIEKEIRRRLGAAVFGVDDETLSSVVGNLLKKNRKTLAVAESCTGGLLGSLITDTPGSSDYFIGGILAYYNRVKINDLSVDPEILKKHGAVSVQTAKAMALGTMKKLGSDFGIGITGIAGPDGVSKKKPVGLVYIAVMDKKRTVAKEFVFRGTRQEIKSRAAHTALNLLRGFLNQPSRFERT